MEVRKKRRQVASRVKHGQHSMEVRGSDELNFFPDEQRNGRVAFSSLSRDRREIEQKRENFSKPGTNGSCVDLVKGIRGIKATCDNAILLKFNKNSRDRLQATDIVSWIRSIEVKQTI